MSGDGMRDSSLWDSQGDLYHRLNLLQGHEIEMYSDIQKIKQKAVCVECGDVAQYHDVSIADGQWLCWKHVPEECSEYEYHEFI